MSGAMSDTTKNGEQNFASSISLQPTIMPNIVSMLLEYRGG